MTTLVALDPGIRCCGFAIFRDGRLTRAALAVNPVPRGADLAAITSMAESVSWVVRDEAGDTMFVSEFPQVYRAVRSKGDPNDLLPLAAVVGAVAASRAWSERSRLVLPAAWKGQMPKKVCEARIRSRLDAEELAVLDSVKGALKHNAVDAVGIGIYTLGRFDRRCGP